MSNQLHSAYAAAPATAATPSLPNPIPTTYSSSRSLSDILSARYLLSDSLSFNHSLTDPATSISMYSTPKQPLRLSAPDIVPTTSHFVSQFSWPATHVASAFDSVVSGIKRSSDGIFLLLFFLSPFQFLYFFVSPFSIIVS